MAKGKRINTYFRQTQKAFRAARQTQIFSRIKRNIPYNMIKVSKTKFIERTRKIKSKISKENLRFAKKKNEAKKLFQAKKGSD